MSKKRSRSPEPSSGYSAGRIATGGLIGLVLTFFLTLASALLLHREMLPLESSAWLGPVIIAVSAFCAAFVSARRCGKKLICGLLAAIVYGLSMVICGMLLFSAPMRTGRLLLSLAALLVGTLGGVALSALRE